MNTTEQHLKRIAEKLQLLVKDYTIVQKENEKLKSDLEVAHQKLDMQQKNTEVLKQQVSVLRLNAMDMSETDKKEFEKKINSYLKEIDRCISLLGE